MSTHGLNYTFIKINTENVSKKFQEKMFALGIKWYSGRDEYLKFDIPYIIHIDDNRMTRAIGAFEYERGRKEIKFINGRIMFEDGSFMKEDKDYFNKTYINLYTKNESKEFQEKMFSLGVKWINNNSEVIDIVLPRTVYIDNNVMALGYGQLNDKKDRKQIAIDYNGDIMFMDEVKSYFHNVREGDSVYCWLYGKGKVIDIKHHTSHPVAIEFENKRFGTRYYMSNGREHYSHENPTLFYDKPELTRPQEPKRFKIINGCEVPDITVKNPKLGTMYYTPDLSYKLHKLIYLANCELDDWRIKNDLLYPHNEDGQQAAIKHALVLLGNGQLI